MQDIRIVVVTDAGRPADGGCEAGIHDTLHLVGALVERPRRQLSEHRPKVLTAPDDLRPIMKVGANQAKTDDDQLQNTAGQGSDTQPHNADFSIFEDVDTHDDADVIKQGSKRIKKETAQSLLGTRQNTGDREQERVQGQKAHDGGGIILLLGRQAVTHQQINERMSEDEYDDPHRQHNDRQQVQNTHRQFPHAPPVTFMQTVGQIRHDGYAQRTGRDRIKEEIGNIKSGKIHAGPFRHGRFGIVEVGIDELGTQKAEYLADQGGSDQKSGHVADRNTLGLLFDWTAAHV